MKIEHPVEDKSSFKGYGLMSAIVTDCVAETKVSTSKKATEYSLLTLSLDVKNEIGKTLAKKLFFRLPYDSWNEKPGESKTLFNQFRDVTKMTTEELNDTKNYIGKTCFVAIGPSKRYSGEWNTFTGRDNGKTLLSLNIVEIFADDKNKETIETSLQNLTKVALDEIKETQPGFTKEDVDNIF